VGSTPSDDDVRLRRRSRRLWHLLEPIHAVTYFAPETTAAYRAVGLKGFWMGYFASRVAPMGPVGVEVADAVLFNFAPTMVARALPDAWDRATPELVLAARATAVETVLGDLLGDTEGVAEAADLVEGALAGCRSQGRALFAGHLTIPRPASAVGRLWRAATLVREHRGDGHVAALVAHGLGGLDAHVVMAASGAVPRDRLQPARGWTDAEWDGAERRLGELGVVADNTLTAEGTRQSDEIEATTDDLAAGPWKHLGDEATERLTELIGGLSARVHAADLIPYPNPIGLPGPSAP
jgi:hypothetical protein